jgi:hypothetical protein
VNSKLPWSVYLLGFVLACIAFILARTPSTPEQARQLARGVSQKILDDFETVGPGVTTKGEFVGIGTSHPDTALHVARKHPDILKLENRSKGGGQWLLQVGGNGWQNGNLMISHRPNGKFALVVEPNGKVITMGDLHVAGKLTSSKPIGGTGPTTAELQAKVDALTKIVEELMVRVGDLEPEDATVSQP